MAGVLILFAWGTLEVPEGVMWVLVVGIGVMFLSPRLQSATVIR